MNNEQLLTNVECNITGSIGSRNNPTLSNDITREKIIGIYKIINKVNGKYYVGSSNDIERRWYNHKIELQGNRHGNKYLQNAWNKYGELNFEFIIIEKTNAENQLIIEQKYLNLTNNARNISYNIGKDATAFFKGHHHSEESKIKMGNANRGLRRSEEFRLRHSNIMKGKFTGNKNPRFGQPMTEKTKFALLLSRIDHNVYTFQNINTNEKFIGTRMEFRKRTGLNRDSVYQLVNGITKKCHGWTLVKEILPAQDIQ